MNSVKIHRTYPATPKTMLQTGGLRFETIDFIYFRFISVGISVWQIGEEIWPLECTRLNVNYLCVIILLLIA